MTPETDAYDEQVDEQGAEERSESNRRLWWLATLLLLLLLIACAAAQLLLPTPRSGKAGATKVGLTPIFGVYGLHQPLGVGSGPDGQIVVADTGVQRAYVYDQNGSLLARLGDDRPNSKVFSVDGCLWAGRTIYVCDWGMRRVWMFDESGKVKGYFPKDPMNAAYGAGGFTPYDVVGLGSDFLVSSRNGVYRFDGRTGTLKGRFDKALETKQLNFPNGIAVSPTGDRVYVCDTLNRRVVAYDSSGRAVWVLGRPDEGGRIAGFFGIPRGIVMTEKGLLVSDTFMHRLVLLDRNGKLLGEYGQRGVTDGELNFPEALDVAPDGLVYIADRENNRVQVVRLENPKPVDAALQKKWRESFEKLGD